MSLKLVALTTLALFYSCVNNSSKDDLPASPTPSSTGNKTSSAHSAPPSASGTSTHLQTSTSDLVNSFKCDGSIKKHQFNTDKSTMIISYNTPPQMDGSSVSLKVFGDGTATGGLANMVNPEKAKTVTKQLSNDDFQNFLSNFLDSSCILNISEAEITTKLQAVKNAQCAGAGSNCDLTYTMASDCGRSHVIVKIDGINYESTFDCNSFSTTDPKHPQLAEANFVSKAYKAATDLITLLTK